MPAIKHHTLLSKDPVSEYQTFKEVLLDFTVDDLEAKKRYLKSLKSTKMKKDKILAELPDFIIKNKFKEGVDFIIKFLDDSKIELEELTLTKATKRLSKGKKLSHKKKGKKILVPAGFSERDHFYQLMTLQHKYKLFTYTSSKASSKVKKDILKTSLDLTVVAINSEIPNHLTENLYNRYKLSLEEIN